jgi:hypothetical protein
VSLEATLSATGIETSASPYTGTADSFITYHLVNEEDTFFADGDARAGEGMYSVDYFTTGAWRTAVEAIKSALKAAGYNVQSVGPEIYETDTRRYHIPILVVEDL